MQVRIDGAWEYDRSEDGDEEGLDDCDGRLDGSDVGNTDGFIDEDGDRDTDGPNEGFIVVDGDNDGVTDGSVDGDADSQIVPMLYVSDDPNFPPTVFKSMLFIKSE